MGSECDRQENPQRLLPRVCPEGEPGLAETKSEHTILYAERRTRGNGVANHGRRFNYERWFKATRWHLGGETCIECQEPANETCDACGAPLCRACFEAGIGFCNQFECAVEFRIWRRCNVDQGSTGGGEYLKLRRRPFVKGKKQ